MATVTDRDDEPVALQPQRRLMPVRIEHLGGGAGSVGIEVRCTHPPPAITDATLQSWRKRRRVSLRADIQTMDASESSNQEIGTRSIRSRRVLVLYFGLDNRDRTVAETLNDDRIFVDL